MQEISAVYAAKELGSHLVVTVPEQPKYWKSRLTTSVNPVKLVVDFFLRLEAQISFGMLYLTDKAEYQRITAHAKAEVAYGIELESALEEQGQGEMAELRRLGIVSERQLDALEIFNMASMALDSEISFAGSRDGNVFYSERGSVQRLVTDGGRLDDYIRIAVAGGVECLKEKYWMPTPGVKRPEIVGSEFEGIAAAWLRDELDSNLVDNKEVLLLERLLVSKHADGRYDLKIHRKKNY